MSFVRKIPENKKQHSTRAPLACNNLIKKLTKKIFHLKQFEIKFPKPFFCAFEFRCEKRSSTVFLTPLRFLFACLSDYTGNPLNENHIRWERVDYEMSSKTKTSFENGTSYLHILNAQRDDIGQFRCIADNRVANPISRDVLLIVKCKHWLEVIHEWVHGFVLLHRSRRLW